MATTVVLAGAIAVHGFAQVSYLYNPNRPSDGTNGLRTFDGVHNSAFLEIGELSLVAPAEAPGDVGIRLDLATFGGAAPEPQQLYGSWVAPVGDGLRLDAGRFVTHLGAEVIPGWDAANWNASTSLLFGYAIPFTHTGLRATYTFTPTLTASLLVVNGWDTVRDNNRGKSVGAQVAVSPGAGLNLTLNYLGGPEQDGEDSRLRHVGNVVATWRRGRVDLMLDAGLGVEALDGGDHAVWWGAAGYVRVGLAPCMSAALRVEHFRDDDGTRTGVAQTVDEVTLTAEARPAEGAALRAELRADHASAPAFVTSDGTSQDQLTVGVTAAFSF